MKRLIEILDDYVYLPMIVGVLAVLVVIGVGLLEAQ